MASKDIGNLGQVGRDAWHSVKPPVLPEMFHCIFWYTKSGRLRGSKTGSLIQKHIELEVLNLSVRRNLREQS